MSEGLALKQKPLNMTTNLMTFLTHCNGPSHTQPYKIIDEHVCYHYELSPSNFDLINIMTQSSHMITT